MLPPGKIKQTLRKSIVVSSIWSIVRGIMEKDIFCRKASVINKGYGSIKKMIIGSDNKIIIGKDTKTTKTLFHIVGKNNIIEIEDHCIIGPNCSFWMEGNNCRIKIGSHTTFTQFCHINAQEDNSCIEIGEDCMFSNHIIVRTSDSHPIYDMDTFHRINVAKSVIIGKKVWIAPDTKIMKGANIGEGCIIGSNTMVSKNIPPHSLAVGMPAKIVRQNVYWTRENVVTH